MDVLMDHVKSISLMDPNIFTVLDFLVYFSKKPKLAKVSRYLLSWNSIRCYRAYVRVDFATNYGIGNLEFYLGNFKVWTTFSLPYAYYFIYVLLCLGLYMLDINFKDSAMYASMRHQVSNGSKYNFGLVKGRSPQKCLSWLSFSTNKWYRKHFSSIFISYWRWLGLNRFMYHAFVEKGGVNFVCNS